MKKIVFFGCSYASFIFLKFLINKKIKIDGVFTKKKSYNHDFFDLTNISKKNKILCRYASVTNSKRTIIELKKIKPDYIICIGWPALLRKKILSIPKINTIGFHPSELPNNRGRHPIIWSIILGLKYTASSFFFINNSNNPDSGKIISQKKILIKKKFNSKELYSKIMHYAIYQLLEIIKKIHNNKLTALKKNRPKMRIRIWRRKSSS